MSVSSPLPDSADSAAWSVEALGEQADGLLGPDGGASFDFLPALAALSESLRREARLTPSGQAAARNALVRSLVVQGMLGRQLREHPDIADQPIDLPVFIIGLPRTGSTLLHNLMDQHPGLHCPQLWELISPYGERDGEAREQAKKVAEDFLGDLYDRAPGLPGIHYMDARRPDECHRLLANTFENAIFWVRYRTPGYAEWLAEQDLDEAYAYHRRQLRSLIWRIPEGIPVFKCPFHVWALGSLVRTYPHARFIYLHRDPKQVIASTASLCAALRSARSDAVDRNEIGRFWLGQVARILDDWPTLRSTLDRFPVLDITYSDLMRDPVGAARRACEFARVQVTADDEARMRKYLDANPQDLHGKHQYGTDEYGIDADRVDDRFSDYRREYVL